MTVKTTYKIVYTVECFEGTEGGMDHDVFTSAKETLEEAIVDLEIANAKDSQAWVIVCDVSKSIQGVNE